MGDKYIYRIKPQKADITAIPALILEDNEIILETNAGTYTGRIAVGTGGGAGTHIMIPPAGAPHDALTIEATSQTYLSLVGQELAIDVTNLLNPDLSGYALKINVLELDNTTPFTPDADYEPATKKYVDDAVIATGGDMFKAVYEMSFLIPQICRGQVMPRERVSP